MQMDMFMDRLRRESGHPLDVARKTVLPNPKDLAYDKLLIDFCSGLDQKLQDELLQGDKSECLIK